MKRLLPLVALLALACGNSQSPLADGGQDAGGDDGGGTTPTGGGDGGPGAPIEVKVRVALPPVGSTDGGETVLVSGSGFVDGFAVRGGSDTSRKTSVTFAGAAATSVNVIDDNRVEVVAPAGVPGSADVAVTNPNGTGACAGCYRYVTPIAIASVDPATGVARGGTAVTVHGQGFTPDLLFTIGGRELIGFAIVDTQTATGRTPAGAEGAADVLALSHDGSGELRSGFVYREDVRVDSVAPGVAGTAGGSKLVVAGAGFTAASLVKIDGALAPSAWVDDGHLELYAPAHAAGAVDVAVDGATLAQGLTYADPGGATVAYALQPSHGRASDTVHVYGTGLTGQTVSFGGTAAAVQPVSDVQLDAVVPACTAGAVAVQVGPSMLGFTCDPALQLDAIAPAEGPAVGGTQVTLTGAGFDLANLHVFVGALEAAVVSATATAITATTPAGSPGTADVTVLAGGLGFTRAAAFTFTTPLALTQVAPALGAQAGGTRVTLYGRGFGDGLSASIGGSAVAGLQVLSPTEATALSPPGTPGTKTVAIARAAESDQVPAAFTYFDPTLEQGGGSGGPLLGTLNITVLDNSLFKTGGVLGAAVQVVLNGGAILTALTDANGQVTFSDDRLVLPAEVTVLKDSYDSVTIDGVETANLTVAIEGPAGTAPPPPTTPPPPPPVQPTPASVGGHVYGFKLAPGTVLSATQKQVARVAIARSGIYALPPFSGAVPYLTVNDDGGPWVIPNLFTLSPTTFYAVYGIEDSSTTPPTFTPMLLGVLRGIRPDPAKAITNADIILDTHLDQAVDVTVLDPPSVSGGHDAFVDLDLGQDGAIPLGRVTQNSDPFHLHFAHLPLASGQGFVFVDQYGRWANGAITTPVTTYLRRVFGDVSGGVTLGPLLPFPVVTQSGPSTFAWTTAVSGLSANLQQLRVQDGTPQQDMSWSALLPGDVRQIAMPDPIRARLQSGTHGYSIVTSVAPGFDFAHWTYSDLYSGNWTAYSFAAGTFQVP